jgi:hypothetical protein
VTAREITQAVLDRHGSTGCLDNSGINKGFELARQSTVGEIG